MQCTNLSQSHNTAQHKTAVFLHKLYTCFLFLYHVTIRSGGFLQGGVSQGIETVNPFYTDSRCTGQKGRTRVWRHI